MNPRRPGLKKSHLFAFALVLTGGLVVNQSCSPSFAHPKGDTIRQDIDTLRDAVLSFSASNRGQYPTSLDQLCDDSDGKAVIEKLPVDPWSRPYVYTAPEGKTKFNIATLGRDGAVGGQEEDADVDLEMLR